MCLIRDALFAGLSLAVVGNIFYKGEIALDYSILLVAIFALFYFTVAYFDGI